MYDLAMWKFLSAVVKQIAIAFLRDFITGNKLVVDNFVVQYGDYVSVSAMRKSVWQHFSLHVDTY